MWKDLVRTFFNFILVFVSVGLICFVAGMIFILVDRYTFAEEIANLNQKYLNKEVSITTMNGTRLEHKRYFVSNYQKDFAGIEILTLHPVGNETKDGHYVEACVDDLGCNTIDMSVNEFKELLKSNNKQLGK